MSTSTRWNLVVSTATDRSLRRFLATQTEDGGKKGALSRFVEDAVNKQIFELTAKKIKTKNSSIPSEKIDAVVAEALAWARAKRR